MADFRLWLEAVSGSFDDYIGPDGKVTLYHYTKIPYGEDVPWTMMTDPNRVGSNFFTQNDMKVSSIPRTFFYIDVDDREKKHFSATANLYKASYPANRIYNLLEDPLGFKQHVRDNNQGVMNVGWLLALAHEHPDYDGVYYKPSRHIVNMFIPIQLELTDESKERLEKNVPMDQRSSFQGAPR